MLAALAILARIEIFMANKPKGYGTWDAALGLALWACDFAFSCARFLSAK